jgi:hypothetical protein
VLASLDRARPAVEAVDILASKLPIAAVSA